MAVEKRQCAPPPPMERFPVGMRVLAVDDDPICLKMLEALLRKCQYHVTTTNQAITALKLLRENKDGFDLVISDVHMPDMDGFKLLEHVGLEMDLPVIMLSGNGETSAVMKGITHGACDYLLKPVRIEELKNIWQHVIRRKKLDNRDHDNFDNGYDGEKPQVNSDGGQGSVVSGSLDRNEKLNRKRKDQAEEDDDEDDEENTNENEDPSTHKRPRVVWSVELHGKFVDAVNQLGIEKAVPKRILELMNVEKLTRENVASHLQKYRLYLKRLNAVASQQANMVAPLGGRDTSFLPMSSLEGYRNFNALMRTGHVPAPHSFQQRTNYPTGMGLHALPPGGVHFGHMQNAISNPFNDICKQQRTSLPGNPYGNVLQGLPAPLELDHMQQKREQEANNYMSSGFCGGGLATAGSRNAVVNPPNSSLLLQANQQQMQARGLGCHTSVDVSSLSSNPFEITVGSSSHLPDLARCNDNWQGINAQCQATSQATSLGRNMMLMPMTTSTNEDSKQFNSIHIGNSKMKLEEYRLDDSRKPNLICSSSMSSSLPNYPVSHLVENQRRQDGLCSLKKEMITVAQSNFDASFLPQFCKVDRSSTDGQMKYRDEYDVDASKFQGGLRSNSGSLDDLVNAMIKPERNDLSFVDGDMGCDIYPISTCL